MRIKLSDAFDLQMGKTPSRNNEEYWGPGHKWVSIKDMSSCDKYITDTAETITDKGVIESGIKYVPTNTVIMSFKLTIGKAAITQENMYTNEAIMAFIDKGVYDIDRDYLFHLISGTDWTAGTNSAVMGLTLNKKTLSNRTINLPALSEQKRIAKELDSVDQAIAKHQNLLEQHDSLIKSRFTYTEVAV